MVFMSFMRSTMSMKFLSQLFQPGVVGARLDVVQDMLERGRFEIGAVGVVDEITTKGFLFEDHFLEAQRNGHPTAADGGIKVIHRLRRGPEAVFQPGGEFL